MELITMKKMIDRFYFDYLVYSLIWFVCFLNLFGLLNSCYVIMLLLFFLWLLNFRFAKGVPGRKFEIRAYMSRQVSFRG